MGEAAGRADNGGFFRLVARDRSTRARCGIISTPRGEAATPLFMPVGTQATVKTMRPEQVSELGFEMVLANAYHLWLRPGVSTVEAGGGLHRFMGWEGLLLTDSGGYQVMSLGRDVEITPDGAVFRSHVDGEPVFLSPELSMDVQERLGADVIMSLDECLPYPAERGRVERSVELNLQWARRCRDAHDGGGGALFGIVQGGAYPDLREESARGTAELGFAGYGIGGLSVGEPREKTLELVERTVANLPGGAPVYLMGVGDPLGIVEAVSLGVDMFDSVLPTRLARNGTAFVGAGRINLRNARFAKDFSSLEESCGCYTCRRFSRAYIRHLVMAREILGLHLLTVHNLQKLSSLMSGVRAAVRAGRLQGLSRELSEGGVPE